jgi:hypothetical protein
MKTKLFILTCLLLATVSLYAQERTSESYLDLIGSPKIVSVYPNTYAGRIFIYISVYSEMKGNVTENFQGSISYRYLGVDNQTIRLLRTEKKYVGGSNTCELFFKLDSEKPTEITLISQEDFDGNVIKLQIEASNNGIKTKYIGDLPKYVEQ